MGVQRLPEEVRKYLETKENCMRCCLWRDGNTNRSKKNGP